MHLVLRNNANVDAIKVPFAACRPGLGAPMTSGEIVIVNLAVAGNIVLTELGDKIAAWRNVWTLRNAMPAQIE